MDQELRWETAGTFGRCMIGLGWLFMWGVVFPVLFLGGLVAIGTLVDRLGEQADDLRWCQKGASTPYEYHQCR